MTISENPYPSILWIRKEERCKGYGKKFVEYYEKKCKNKGLSKMYVTVIKESENFWRKMSYNPVKNSNVMEKDLNS